MSPISASERLMPPPKRPSWSWWCMSATMSTNGSAASKRRFSTMSGDPAFRFCLAEYENQISDRWYSRPPATKRFNVGNRVITSADRSHQEVLHADRCRRVCVVEGADVGVGLDERDLLLEVERRLVPAPHDVRHDLLGRREVAHELAVGPLPPQHGAGSYSGPRYGHPVGFAELLAHPEVVEELELRSPVGFLALHGGLEPGTAEIARERGGPGGSVVLHGEPASRAHVHVPSVDADPEEAPRLAAFLDHVRTVISVHGYYRPLERPQSVLVGGANRALVTALAAELRDVLPHYRVVDDVDAIPSHMRGLDPRNPVNLAERGGVQLELPHHLRTVRPSRYDTESALHEQHTAVLLATIVEFASRLTDRSLSMARLAVVGGHSILGTDLEPGDQATHVVLQRHLAADRHVARTSRRPRSQHAVARRSRVRPRARHQLGRWPAARARCRHVPRPRRLHRPAHLRFRSTTTSAATPCPSFDVEWRRTVVDAWTDTAADVAPLVDGGVYWQAFGPRFETPAEIRFIAPVRRCRGHDDAVGVHRGGRARPLVCGGVRRRQSGERHRRATAHPGGVRSGKRANERRCSPRSTA